MAPNNPTPPHPPASAYDPYHFKRNYKLGPEIGRGGFGVVYSGFRVADREPVAIKYVARRNVTDWAHLRSREVSFIWGLKTRNLTLLKGQKNFPETSFLEPQLRILTL